MFYSIKGKVIFTDANTIVVETGGIGYKCTAAAGTVAAAGGVGSDVSLLTHLYIREDALELFGFSDQFELDCFKMLISVSGVGPKAAIAVLSELPADRFALCVASGDVKSITRAPGVGAKLAQRIVLELGTKISPQLLAETSKGGGASTGSAPVSGNSAPDLGGFASNAADAIAALVVLGYPQVDAFKVVSKLDSKLTVDEMIKASLRQL